MIDIYFGNSFNQPIQEGVLPASTKYLYFGHGFNQPIQEGVLPSSITNLYLGDSFNQPITNDMLLYNGQNIEIRVGISFHQPINNLGNYIRVLDHSGRRYYYDNEYNDDNEYNEDNEYYDDNDDDDNETLERTNIQHLQQLQRSNIMGSLRMSQNIQN